MDLDGVRIFRNMYESLHCEQHLLEMNYLFQFFLNIQGWALGNQIMKLFDFKIFQSLLKDGGEKKQHM